MKRSSSRRMSATMTFRSSSFGSMISLRLKASSWRVSRAARVPASESPQCRRRADRPDRSPAATAAEPENHGQQVEVVSHAGGQLSTLHLLRLLIRLNERRWSRQEMPTPRTGISLAEQDAARAVQPAHDAVGPTEPASS
jgi:hypothetical protein